MLVVRIVNFDSTQVDPIVASFCGGSVGVLSALLVVEINNIRKQQRNRCHYCDGTGYLSCGNCVGTGYVEVSSCFLGVLDEHEFGCAAVNLRDGCLRCGNCVGIGSEVRLVSSLKPLALYSVL